MSYDCTDPNCLKCKHTIKYMESITPEEERSLFRELSGYWHPDNSPKPNRPVHKLVPYLGLHGKSQFLYCSICGKKEAELLTSVYCEDSAKKEEPK